MMVMVVVIVVMMKMIVVKLVMLIMVVVVRSLSHVQLCNPMNCSVPGFPALHYLPDFVQTHLHSVGDAIKQSHSLSPPSPLALYLSQHQGLFQ